MNAALHFPMTRSGALDLPTVRVLVGDLRYADISLPAGVHSLVVSNPPFRPLGRGRVSPDTEREAALSEFTCTMDDLVHAAARLLDPQGTLAVIYPADRLQELAQITLSNDLRLTHLRFTHPPPQSNILTRFPSITFASLVAAYTYGQGRTPMDVPSAV